MHISESELVKIIKEETDALLFENDSARLYDYILLKEAKRIEKVHAEMDEMLNEGFMDSLVKELPHLGLDVLGVFPGFGEAADLTNAALYAKKGEYFMAALSVISMIPIVGDIIGKGGKLGVYLGKFGGQGAGKASAMLGKTLHKHLPAISKMFGSLKKNKMLKPYVDDMVKGVSRYIDDAAKGGVEAVEKLQQAIAVAPVKAVDDITLKKVVKQATAKRAARKKKELIATGPEPTEEPEARV